MLSTGEAYAAISGRSVAMRLFHRGCPTLRLRSDSHLWLEQAGGSKQSSPACVTSAVLEQLNFLDFKGDQVLYICNSRGRPGCTLGFLFFRPGAHGPTQDRLCTPHVNGDPAGV